MATEVRLSLRQTQRVVMTPLLQQAIQLLQLSTLELQELVQKELDRKSTRLNSSHLKLSRMPSSA